MRRTRSSSIRRGPACRRSRSRASCGGTRRASCTSRVIRRRWRATRSRSSAAGYGLSSIEAFDLFPNTPHVETLAVFDQRDAVSASPRPRRARGTARRTRRSARSSPDATARRRRTPRPGFSMASTMPSGAVADTTKPGATSSHGLMMPAVDRRPVSRPSVDSASRSRQPRAGCDGDVVRDRVRAAVDRGGTSAPGSALGNVLNQRAAGGDVQHLRAAADREQRQIARERRASRAPARIVAHGVDLDGRVALGVAVLARDRRRRRR